MKISLILLKFLFIGALFIVSTHNFHLSDKDDFDSFVSLYKVWVSSLFDNMKDISGYIVKSEWLPGDRTEISFELVRDSGIFKDN